MKRLPLWMPIFLAACSVGGTSVRLGTTGDVDPQTGALREQKSLELLSDTELSTETVVTAAALYVYGHPVNALGLPGQIFSPANVALLYAIYDPLAPNWSVKEQVLDKDTYHLSLRAKSFRTGGDGEALRIVKRRALFLQRSKGYDDFRIVDYSEGVESGTPLTHRFSEGTIQLVRKGSQKAR